MTPIADFGNPALADGLTGAVQFEPSGLRFARLATLRIGAVGALPVGSRRVGFSSASDGTRMQLTLPTVVNGGTEILVAHFSNAGAAAWTPTQANQAPPDPSTDKSQFAFWDDAVLRLDVINAATIAAVLARWLDEFVNVEVAKASGDLGGTFDADTAFATWLIGLNRLALLAGDDVGAALRVLVAPAQAQTKAALARKLLPFIDSSLAPCQIDIDVLNASFIQRHAAEYGIDTVEFGLDRPGFLRKVNNCLRPVLDPATLPSPLSPGQPVSLDARAQGVFNGWPNPVDAGFEFTITATDATVATPVGLSHGEGRYTTVFTPSTTAPTFNVRACLALNDGSALGSDICVTQQVGSPRVARDCLGTQTDLCPKCGAFGAVNPFSMRVTQTGNVVTMLVRGAPIVGTLAADGSIVTKFSPNDPGGIRGRFSDVGFDGVMEDDFSKSSDTEDVSELRLVRQ
jgi:hypothetical protein